MRYIQWICISSFLLITACRAERKPVQENASSSLVTSVVQIPATDTILPHITKSRTALYLDSLGLKEIRSADSSIVVKLMYATDDNFTGELLYEDLREAYLHPDALESLLKAQQLLKSKCPAYSLIIYDAARPMSVQKKMWNIVKGTSKSKYVSNPARGGGLHNYGLAVDVSIVNENGETLPMGTEVDHLGIEAHITNEAELVKSGKISEEARKNRLLLRQVMKEAGFRALNSEWWHFNKCGREEARQKYRRIE